MEPRRLAMTTTQFAAALARLEGEQVSENTICRWAQTGLIVSSIRNPKVRGGDPRDHGRLWSVADLARARLFVRLRREGVPSPRIRVVLAWVDAELREVLKPNTKAVLVVTGSRGVIVRRPGHADQEIPSGQLRLPLAEVWEGNEEAAALVAA